MSPTIRHARKEIRCHDRELRRLGFTLIRGKRHLIYLHANGARLAVPQTVSDHHSLANNLSVARKLARA